MGYRSHVVIALSKPAQAKMLLTGKTLPEWFKEEAELTRLDLADYYDLDGVKWYDNYPEVQEVEAFLENFATEDFGFIRVGEDPTDLTEMGTPGEYDLWPETHINTPYTL